MSHIEPEDMMESEDSDMPWQQETWLHEEDAQEWEDTHGREMV